MAPYYTIQYPYFGHAVPVQEIQYQYPPIRGSLLELFEPPSVSFNGTVLSLGLTLLPTQCLRFNGSCGSFPFFIGNVTVAPSTVQLHVGDLIRLNETVDLSLKFGKQLPEGTNATLSVAVFSTSVWCDADQNCQARLGEGKTLELNLSPYLARTAP